VAAGLVRQLRKPTITFAATDSSPLVDARDHVVADAMTSVAARETGSARQ
jgi:hypothetical protein